MSNIAVENRKHSSLNTEDSSKTSFRATCLLEMCTWFFKFVSDRNPKEDFFFPPRNWKLLKWKLFLLPHLSHLFSHKMHTYQLFCNWFLPLIKAAVNNGVVHGRTHGKPKTGQIDLLNVFPPIQLLIDPSNYEVSVVGQPTDGKCHHNHNHHFYHLTERNKNSVL